MASALWRAVPTSGSWVFALPLAPVVLVALGAVKAGLPATGVVDAATVAKINQEEPRTFLALFALHKIARYADICKKRPDSKKFFFGWVRRALEGV